MHQLSRIYHDRLYVFGIILEMGMRGYHGFFLGLFPASLSFMLLILWNIELI